MTNDSATVAIGQIGDISQVSGMLAIGGDVVVGNKTVIQHIVQQAARELIVHPYKFLSAYDISDKNIFFGRDALTKQLAGKISRHKVLLLNGASGSGKSSLINAGLIPYLAENGYTYLSFRDYSNPVQQLQNCLIDSGISTSANLHPEFLDHTLTVFKNSKLQVVFVFDQFERFFVNVPSAARVQFIEMIKVSMETLHPTEMNVIFTMREEFFGQFQREFEKVIHAFLNECERVNIEPLSKSEARQAIVKPLTLIEAKIGYDEDFIDDVLLVGLEAETCEKGISPSHLQIVCNQLYQAACQQLEHKHFVVIDHKLYEQLGGTQTILRTYLDDCVKTVANHEIEHIQLLHSLLKQMIETVGTRKFVTAQQLHHNLPDVAPSQIDQFLMQLQDARVIEMRPQEASYSLSHEFMVEKVKDWFDEREMARKRAAETLEHGLSEWKNSETLLTEKQILRIRTAQIALNAEEQEFLCTSETACIEQRHKEEAQIRQIALERDARQNALNSRRKII
jgi:energy-coupling factor transporter ATP-binding protein EcfA2